MPNYTANGVCGMDNTVTIRAPHGEIWCGYYRAATVRDVTAVRAATDAGTVTATIVSRDAFRVSQRPLTFVVPHKHGVWRWPIAELQIADDRLTASLSPPG